MNCNRKESVEVKQQPPTHHTDTQAPPPSAGKGRASQLSELQLLLAAKQSSPAQRLASSETEGWEMRRRRRRRRRACTRLGGVWCLGVGYLSSLSSVRGPWFRGLGVALTGHDARARRGCVDVVYVGSLPRSPRLSLPVGCRFAGWPLGRSVWYRRVGYRCEAYPSRASSPIFLGPMTGPINPKDSVRSPRAKYHHALHMNQKP